MHGVGVWQEVRQIFTVSVNLQISNVQFSLHALHGLTCKRFLVLLCKLCTVELVLMCAVLVINYGSPFLLYQYM